MERDRISQTQLCALLWAGLMAPAAELLPAVTLPIAGRGAWLSALAALPVLLLLGWGLGRLGLRHGGLAGAIRWGLGPVVGRLVLLLYFIWGELLLALRLRLCAQRLIASGERDGSLWFFLPAAALLVLWMARGKLPAFARAGQVFLAVLLTAAGAVLLLSLPQVRGEHLLPLWWGDALPVLRSTVPLLGVLAFALWKAAKQVFPRAKQKPTVTAILIPGAVLGIAAFPEGVMADAFGRETALLGNLMMGLALPLLVLAVCWGRGMFRHSPHFVYKSAQKTEDMVAEEQSEKKTEKTEKND